MIELRILKHHEDNIYLIDFTADGRSMATASGDNTAAIWDLAPANQLSRLARRAGLCGCLQSRRHAVGDRQWRRPGDDLERTRWHELLGAKKHADAVYCLAFSPDGKQLATVGGNGDGGDTMCRLWDAPTLTLRAEFTGHQFPVYGVAFAPDGKMLATSSRDKTVRLWRLPDGECRVLEGHTSDVHRCAFSPDGKVAGLGQSGRDGARCGMCRAAACIQVLHGSQDPLYAAAFSPDGKLIASVGDDFRLHIWRTDKFQMVSDEKLARCAVRRHVSPGRAACGRGRSRNDGPDLLHGMTAGSCRVWASSPVPVAL